MSSQVIDGSTLEGGGQILRNSVALATLLGKHVTIENIRGNRNSPGLKAQHAAGLRLVADISSAALTGCEIGSSTIDFNPGPINLANAYKADPGTAGSTTLLLQVSLPCLLFSPSGSSESDITLCGGTNADNAPQIDYTQQVFLPFLQRRLHLEPKLTIHKRGYYPKGGGIVHFSIPSISHPLPAVNLTERGRIKSVSGRAYVAGLPRSLAAQMQAAAVADLVAYGIDSSCIDIAVVREKDGDAVGSGSGIVLWAESEEGCILGGSALGSKKRNPSDVGREATAELIRNLSHGGCVDEYLQDQIIIFLALAEGRSVVKTGPLTLHTRTAIWVAEQLTPARFHVTEDEEASTATISCTGFGHCLNGASTAPSYS